MKSNIRLLSPANLVVAFTALLGIARDATAAVAQRDSSSEARASVDDRIDPPERTVRAEIRADLRERYRERLADESDEARLELARELREISSTFYDDPPGRFVYYDEARSLALEAAHLGEALLSIIELEREFRVDGVELRVDAVERVAAAASRETAESIAQDVLSVVIGFLSAGETNPARELLHAGRPLEQKISKKSDVWRRWESTEWRISRREAAQDARRTLESDSNDLKALRTLGRYLCLVEYDFDRGLAKLSRSFLEDARGLKRDEKRLRDAVEADVGATADPITQERAGDEWFELAKHLEHDEKRCAALRAIYWYERALSAYAGKSYGNNITGKIEDARALAASTTVANPVSGEPIQAGAKKADPEKITITRVGLDTGTKVEIVYYVRDAEGSELVHGHIHTKGPEGGGQAAPEYADVWRKIVRENIPADAKFGRGVVINATRPHHPEDHGQGKRCSWSCDLDGRGAGKPDKVCTTNEVRHKR